VGALAQLRLGVWAVWLTLASGPVFALEINMANEAELDSLRGMGPSMTAKVLAARELAPFLSWQDVMQRVAGLGKSKARQFSDQGLSVNGQMFMP